MRFTPEQKIQLVARYHAGETIAKMSEDSRISRSTLYSWIHQHESVITSSEKTYTVKEIQALERKVAKLMNIIKILKSVPCTVSSPLHEKLDALETLHGPFDVYTLCEALEVSRGTFYNHILRNKRGNAWFEKRRKECRILVRQVFDDNNQIFGAAKIRAILVAQGHQISTKYVTELMQEMGLTSVSPTSKKSI